MKPLNIPPVAAQRMVAQAQAEIRDTRVERNQARTLAATPPANGGTGCAVALIVLALAGYVIAGLILIF